MAKVRSGIEYIEALEANGHRARGPVQRADGTPLFANRGA